jgi:hypothetical protein
VLLCVFDSLARMFVFFCFPFFCLFCGFDGYSSMEEDQVVHDATQVVGNSGVLHAMMELHDVLNNIE